MLDDDDPPPDVVEGTDPYKFSKDDAEHIHRGLEKLPLPQREALTLFFLAWFSVKEIAGVALVSTGTIKSRLHYGKKKLREIIEREGQSHE